MLGTHLLSRAVYRANFLAAANESGLLSALGKRALSFDEIASTLGCAPAQHETLVDWLSVAVLSGVLKRTRDGRYAIKGILARAMARSNNEDAATALHEVSRLHADVIYRVPGCLKKKSWLTLGDHDAVVAARASRALEPVMAEAIEDAVKRFDPGSYLDVGCGTGIYLRYASEANNKLTGKGIDLNPDVAAFAQSKMSEWGMADRFSVSAGDFRSIEPTAEYGLASLINNLCYFRAAERPEVIRHLTKFVRPGGGVMIAHPLRGLMAASDVVSLFFAAIEDAGPFPEPGEIESCMARAGVKEIKTITLVPGIVSVTGRVAASA
ncbi:MAG: class I SAM-dependent methyltransferase [Kofleriaceae bacterium]